MRRGTPRFVAEDSIEAVDAIAGMNGSGQLGGSITRPPDLLPGSLSDSRTGRNRNEAPNLLAVYCMSA